MKRKVSPLTTNRVKKASLLIFLNIAYRRKRTSFQSALHVLLTCRWFLLSPDSRFPSEFRSWQSR